jgi:hypothetical protein
VLTTLVAVAMEVSETRRTGRRRWVLAWLPMAVGSIVFVALAVALGPQGPDSGLAASVALAIALGLAATMAVSVNALAALVLQIAPR